jgi:hypothetical protein
MAVGFLLESGSYDTPRVTQWVGGAPEQSFWTGLRLSERDVLAVTTYRCARCGYLESYARAAGAADAGAG